MLLGVLVQVVEEGEIELDLANQCRVEEALLLQLDEDLGLLELGNRLAHEFDEYVRVEVDDGRAGHVLHHLSRLLLVLHGDLAHDIHGIVSIDA